MTDEQIREFMNKHFEGVGIRDDGSFSEYSGSIKNFLNFAREIYEEGYDDGCYTCTGGQ